MGSKKPKTTTIYQAAPPPTSAPPQTPEQLALQQQFQQQQQSIQQQMQQQLQGMQEQYAANSTANNSLVAALQEQFARQQASIQQQAGELSEARRISADQAALVNSSREAQQAQYADRRAQEAGNAASLLGRLQRRRLARRTAY